MVDIDWSRSFAPQKEILQYYQGLAEHLELRKSTYFNTEVVSAEWIEPELLWHVHTRDVNTGELGLWTCNMVSIPLFFATIGLSIPGSKLLSQLATLISYHILPSLYPAYHHSKTD